MTKPDSGMPCTVLLADGKEHALRFPLRALKELKATHGLDLLRGGAEIARALDDPDNLATVLLYGLTANEPTITREWVESNVDAAMLMEIAPRLIYAATGQWVADQLQAATNGASPNGTASGATSRPTGSNSGASDATTSASASATSGT